MTTVRFDAVVHPVSRIIAQYLIGQGLGVDPATIDDAGFDTDWLLYTTNLPQHSNNCIAINDTTPEKGIRNQVALYTCLRYGLQIRTRNNCDNEAWKRAHEIKIALDRVANQQITFVDYADNDSEHLYKFHGIETVSGPIPLGQELETGQGKRYLMSHNVLVSITPDVS